MYCLHNFSQSNFRKCCDFIQIHALYKTAERKQSVELPISQKMQMIKVLDAGRTRSDLVKKFNIERTTVTRLKRKKIQIVFLPPNVTSHIQLLDQGIRAMSPIIEQI